MSIIVVYGPPGSGKTTIVREKMREGDMIIDQDAIFSAISGLPQHHNPENLLPHAIAVKQFLISRMMFSAFPKRHNVYVITTSEKEKEQLRREFGATVWVVDVKPNECLRRIVNDKSRPGNGKPWQKYNSWEPIVFKWFENYRQDSRDIVIKNKRRD